LRLAGTLIIIAVGGGCALLLAVRFVVFPQIESHRLDIAAALASRIGQPVEIDAIATGWDGWNPKLSIRGLRIRERGDDNDAVLELPRVDLVVAWASLPLLDLRLRELIVEGPMLAIRRDAQGRVHLAGFAIDPDRQADDVGLTEWLLRQREVIVRDALIVWEDELRNAPQLVLDQVTFRMEHTLGRHRFALHGTPPVDLASPLDLRGDVLGLDGSDWRRIDGRFYVRLDYADLAAWREWLPMALDVDSGEGALRLWIEVAGGQPRDVLADFELADVRARLARDLPPLRLNHVAGRMGWKHDGAHHEISARALQFRAGDGTVMPPTDFSLQHDDAANGREARGRLSFARLDLGPLSALAAHLPLPETVRRDLARYRPRGVLNDGKYAWVGPADAPRSFTASGAFDRLGVNAQDLFPGGVGVSGSFQADEAKGTLELASRALTLELPRVLAEPLRFDSATGNIRWERSPESLRVVVSDLAYANAHAAGTAAGVWRSQSSGPGVIDLKAQLTRANVEHLHRYLPRKLSPRVRDWVKSALPTGISRDVKLVLAGNLADFPFPGNRNGQFLVTIKGQGGTLDYAQGWPPISGIDADVRFEGTRLSVDAAHGNILGARIGRTRAEIPDLREPVLRISGEASGATPEFLSFLTKTPLYGEVAHFVDKVTATGDARLALEFEMPLEAPERTTVAGDFRLAANQVRISGAPTLAEVSGTLNFTEQVLSGTDIAATAFGVPLRLQLSGSGDRVRVNASGTAHLAAVRKELDSPLAGRITGTIDWRAVIDARPQGASWVLESSLKGVAIDLPAPLGKTAAESVALRIERREPAPAQRDEQIAVEFGSAARALLRRPQTSGASFDRALVLLGKAVERVGDIERTGLWIRADVAALNLDPWLTVARSVDLRGHDANATTAASDLQGVDIEAGVLQTMGRDFHDIKGSARRAGDDWRIALDGREGVGTAVWRAPTSAMPNGRLVARLSRLSTAGTGDPDSASAAAGEPVRKDIAVNSWPEIDLTADALYSKAGRDLGKLTFTARPAGPDWQIQSFTLVNDAGSIRANGWWRDAARPQTSLDVTIATPEAGAFLARFGTPDAIKGAPTKIEGQLAWPGSPGDFDTTSLTGSFRVVSEPGQFLKADPGVGRLLGELSLQALPRRITLDFRDVFSDGFAFDSINGSVKIADGVMSTSDLRMIGPAATVDISGSVDLERETQQLRVRVLPALSTSISAGAAALFIANPLVGAAVGAGALLAQKVLKDPFEQLFSYEYAVSGGWSDPLVERLGSRTASLPAATATK
jgi:uncharacterized protein (TIGR02099 family)